MNKLLSKGTVVVLALTLILGTLLTACGNNNEVSNKPSDKKSNEPATKEKEKITITFWEQGWDGPKEDKILPIINEKIGVELVYEPWVVSSESERQNKLSLLSASGELPDVFFGPTDNWTRSLFNKFGEQDKMWDLTPYFKKYPNVLKTMQRVVPLFRNPTDKKSYMYPTQVRTVPRFSLGYNVRKDWLDQVGKTYPKSIDEFYEILKAFKEQIKPTSGQPVTPLVFSPGLNEREVWWITPWFAEDARTWSLASDGSYTLKHFTDIPQLQEMVAFFNKIYREGLLDQEALVIKDAQLKEKFAQDRVGVHFLNSYEISTIVDDLKQGEAKDISYILMPWIFDEGIDGTYNGNRKLGPEAPSGLYISKALSEYQVDELFKALDWMLTLDGQLLVNYGIEGEHWNYDADGKIQKTQAFIDRADHDWNKEAHEGVGYYQQIAYNELVFEELIPESIRFPRPESKITHEHQKSIWSDKPSEDLDPILYTSPGAVEQELLASIGIAWNDMVIKAILAKSEADARNIVTGWPDTLNKMGWDKIVKERGDSAKSLDMNW